MISITRRTKILGQRHHGKHTIKYIVVKPTNIKSTLITSECFLELYQRSNQIIAVKQAHYWDINVYPFPKTTIMLAKIPSR